MTVTCIPHGKPGIPGFGDVFRHDDGTTCGKLCRECTAAKAFLNYMGLMPADDLLYSWHQDGHEP